tara:strand:- start:425 stop:751 length:327 start_codon:yes stop_codon:yes gene_type:complete
LIIFYTQNLKNKNLVLINHDFDDTGTSVSVIVRNRSSSVEIVRIVVIATVAVHGAAIADFAILRQKPIHGPKYENRGESPSDTRHNDNRDFSAVGHFLKLSQISEINV